MVKGVVDRFTDEKKAVILVDKLQKQFIVNIEKLPRGCKEGSWLYLVLSEEQEEILSCQLDESSIIEKQKAVSEKMARLRAKSRKSSRLKRKSE